MIVHKLLLPMVIAAVYTGCHRESPKDQDRTVLQLFEKTIGAYTANAMETDARYDVKKTDSLVTPFQAIYYATFVAGDGSRLQKRKVFNYRDGDWQVVSVEHCNDEGEWVRGSWVGSTDQDLSMERYYWEQARKKPS